MGALSFETENAAPHDRMTIATAKTLLHRVTRTHCPYCAFQCGMTITTSDSKSTQVAFEIAPDDFPVNRGQMCIKGYTAGELLTDPEGLPLR